MKNSFTLLEMLIVLVVISMIIGTIFTIYEKVSNISVYVENHKNISEEMLYFSQVMENLLDKNKINFNEYSSIETYDGYTGTLILTGNSDTKLYSSGNCNINNISNNFCYISREKNGEKVEVTNKDKVFVKNLSFKLIPYVSASNQGFEDIYNQGVQVSADFYVKNYKKNWPFNVKQDYQSFFNIR